MAYRILIVDDSPAMRAFVRRALRLSGFDVEEYFEAASGQEALTLLNREWVDAILTDINMPGMDGKALLGRLSCDPLLKWIPTLVISTDATAGSRRTMLSLGARAYVTKPFDPEELRRELEQCLGECKINRHPVPGEDTVPAGCRDIESSRADGEIQEALRDCVGEVFEKMFFIRIPSSRSMEAAIEQDSAPDQMGASVRFEGRPSGALSIAMDTRVARGIAEDFLGVQDIDSQQVEDVVRELANITCGAVLSRIESEATFRLDSPRSGMHAPDARSQPTATWDFALGTEPVTVKLWMESARCHSTDQSGS